MAQFDIYRLDGGQLVVDLQTDLIGLDVTRLVSPLRDEQTYVAFPGITPLVAFEGQRWVVRVQQLSALPASALGRSIGHLRAEQGELLRAIDILTHGF